MQQSPHETKYKIKQMINQTMSFMVVVFSSQHMQWLHIEDPAQPYCELIINNAMKYKLE